mgnify:CR=1 FL=1
MDKRRNYKLILYLVFMVFMIIVFVLLVSCNNLHNSQLAKNPDPTITITAIASPTKTTPRSITPSVTSTIQSPTRIETTIEFYQECMRPSDNYDPVEINGHQLNQRTYEMLQQADFLYDGLIDITDTAITQGSYTSAVEASFGTHSGGGAVDLSVMAPGTYTILYEEIDPLIKALRLAGFAAWFRDLDELYNSSPAHIHAIAIGDRELSMPAREQLAGPHGYFWGYNGLPTDAETPTRDPHGGPIICEWMIELGYPNKTATPYPGEIMP